jgi:hypothetical protein
MSGRRACTEPKLMWSVNYPSNSYVPALLGVYDDGAWVGLV